MSEEYAELKQLDRQQATTIWATPPANSMLDEKIFKHYGVLPDTLYIGTQTTERGAFPTYERPVYSMKTARATKQKLKTAAIADLKESDNPYHPEWREAAAEHRAEQVKRIKEGRLKTAGFGTNAAWSTIDQVNVTTTVLGLEFPDRTAIESVLTINTPSIELNVDVGTPYEGHESITEGVEVEPNRQTYARTSFDPPKDIAFFGMTDEAGMKAQHPVFQLHVQNSPQVLRKIENGKIVAVLETSTDVGGADMGAFTTGLSDNNPFESFRTVIDTIRANGGNMSNYRIVSHNKSFTDYIGNTFVRGAYNNIGQGVQGGGRVVTHDRLPGATWYIDDDHTNTIVTVFASDAFVRANGPTMVAQWRDENRGIELYKASHFNETKLVQSGRARDLTGMSA